MKDGRTKERNKSVLERERNLKHEWREVFSDNLAPEYPEYLEYSAWSWPHRNIGFSEAAQTYHTGEYYNNAKSVVRVVTGKPSLEKDTSGSNHYWKPH